LYVVGQECGTGGGSLYECGLGLCDQTLVLWSTTDDQSVFQF